MKKFTILTSLLALTACGGGGHGGNGPIDMRADAIASNASVTNMTSFVVVGGSNPTVNPNARVAGIMTDDGGVRYDLSNVTLKSIPTSGVIADLKFNTDENGKIISIEYPDADKIMAEHSGSDITNTPMMRRGDTNVFVETGVLDEEFGELAGRTIEIPTKYVSYAENTGLTYADFGVLETDIAGTGIPELAVWGVMETPFAGGYDIKKVDNEKMRDIAQNGDVVFSGWAKGSVSYHDWKAGIGGADVALPGGLTDKEATLTFAQDGSQTLAADFTNWAKIEAVKAADGTNQFKVIEPHVDSSSHYYLTSSPSGLVDSHMGEHTMAFQTGYYGDDGVPTEAVGLVQYQHQYGDLIDIEGEDRKDYEHHLNVDLGFGGIKQ